MQADDKPEKPKRLRLSKDVQRRIVIMLACYCKNPEIIQAIKDDFSVEITRQNVNHYNPEHTDEVAEEWKDLFETARENYNENISSIPIAQLAWRLRERQKMYDEARSPQLKSELLTEAARDAGGAYTNKKQITGEGGGAVQISIVEAVKPDGV